MLIYGATVKVIADAALTTLTPDTLPRALGLGWFSMIGTGWLSVSLIVCIQLTCEDKNIGLATMLLGSMRSSGGAVAVTVYSTILGNTVRSRIVRRVMEALKPLGVPQRMDVAGAVYLATQEVEGRCKKFKLTNPALAALNNPKVCEVAWKEMRWVWGEAFRGVFIAATAFAAVALVAAFFVKDVSKNMTDNVAVRLQNEKPQTRDVETTSG